MIADFWGNPRYYDKTNEQYVHPPSPELLKLYAEMAANPRFHISREFNFYPKGFPSFSPGWGIG